MASKVRWTLRYFWLKLNDAYDATHTKFQALGSRGSVNDDVARKLMDQLSDEFTKAFYQRVTEVIRLVGPSMAPTLNRKADTSPSETELLILRRLRAPSESNVRVGDIVAFSHPVAQDLMVRRVWGVPGDELADETGSSALTLEPGTCWVVADNEALKPPHVEDSRTFGPLLLRDIEGRVVYAIRSLTDHGPVDNSESSLAEDAPLIDVEVADTLQDPELFQFQEGPAKDAATPPTAPVKDDA